MITSIKRGLRFIWLNRRDNVSVLDLRDDAAWRLPATAPGRACREMQAVDLRSDDFAGFGQERLERAKARFETCRGVTVVELDRPLGWAFMTTAPRPREGRPPLVYAVTPGPGWAYVFDVFARPEARRRGVARDLLVCCARLAAEQGLAGLFLTHAHPAMTRAAAGLGFQTVGILTFRQVFGIKCSDLSALDRINPRK
ncbi:MAG: GNAT family N-acetyltransferase [Pseudomonadota bacterium]